MRHYFPKHIAAPGLFRWMAQKLKIAHLPLGASVSLNGPSQPTQADLARELAARRAGKSIVQLLLE